MLLVITVVRLYCFTPKMLKETETEETISCFRTFLSFMSFQLGEPGPPAPPHSVGYAHARQFVEMLLLQNKPSLVRYKKKKSYVFLAQCRVW